MPVLLLFFPQITPFRFSHGFRIQLIPRFWICCRCLMLCGSSVTSDRFLAVTFIFIGFRDDFLFSLSSSVAILRESIVSVLALNVVLCYVCNYAGRKLSVQWTCKELKLNSGWHSEISLWLWWTWCSGSSLIFAQGSWQSNHLCSHRIFIKLKAIVNLFGAVGWILLFLCIRSFHFVLKRRTQNLLGKYEWFGFKWHWRWFTDKV